MPKYYIIILSILLLSPHLFADQYIGTFKKHKTKFVLQTTGKEGYPIQIELKLNKQQARLATKWPKQAFAVNLSDLKGVKTRYYRAKTKRMRFAILDPLNILRNRKPSSSK